MKRVLIECAVAVVLLAVIAFLIRRNGQLCNTSAQYRRNTETLLSDIEQYQIRDSINVARCNTLELKLSEFERFRAQDAAIIADLQSDKRDLERVASFQAQTIKQLSARLRDTIIIRDSIPLKSQTIRVRDKWYDLNAEIIDGIFQGTIVNRDSIIVVESVKMSRCIVQKWRRVKNRTIDVLSKNPDTEIIGVEHVILEK